MRLTNTELKVVRRVVGKYIDRSTGLQEDAVQNTMVELLQVPTSRVRNRDRFAAMVARNTALELINSRTQGPWGSTWITENSEHQILSLEELEELGFQFTGRQVFPPGGRYQAAPCRAFYREVCRELH